MNLAALGLKIKALRTAKGWSLEFLAGEANVAKNSIYQLENGEGNPTVLTLESLGNALGEALIYLPGGARPPVIREMQNPSLGTTARMLEVLDRDHLLRGVVFALVLDDDSYIEELDMKAVRQLLRARL